MARRKRIWSKPLPVLTSGEEERLGELGQWVVTTCLIGGSSVSTAFKVAALFVSGLESEWEKAKEEATDVKELSVDS